MKKGSLKRHMRTVHEGRSDFECDECGKRFKSYQSMKVRIGGHTSTPSCISMLFLFLLISPQFLYRENFCMNLVRILLCT